ncbi:spore germination protein [Chengkuizengella axinellae]|uniref:Spore germination protein n=1 Tax=Chengkuizengella axinellae TaxID=3064388 RepID=A0ABT9J4R7_9BACL|nr:spore germination protein [Chengkuizengella sp. 2205SS18-9]MDP5276590.1 spore germination protein [Chengkuizengella sp. 2205SS18-9]
MPSVLGIAKVINVSGGAKLLAGDTIQITPVSYTKAYIGSGSGNAGDLPRTNNFVSTTNTIDADIKDQTQDNIFGIEDNVFPFLFI